MAYRNGTYVAFHANGTSDPTESDMKYYNTLRMWHNNEDIEFSMVNSHEKASSVRDSSTKQTLRNSLLERLKNSKNFLIIIGDTTRFDNDWVPFEITNAIDNYKLPVIAVYPKYDYIVQPNHQDIRNLWPEALRARIDNRTARTIHIPFKQNPIKDAISQFSIQKYPNGSLSYYGIDIYRKWGIAA